MISAKSKSMGCLAGSPDGVLDQSSGFSRTSSISELISPGKTGRKASVVEQIESKQRETLNNKMKELKAATGRTQKEKRVRMPTLALSKGTPLNIQLPKPQTRSDSLYKPVTPVAASVLTRSSLSIASPSFSNSIYGNKDSLGRPTFRTSKSWSSESNFKTEGTTSEANRSLDADRTGTGSNWNEPSVDNNKRPQFTSPKSFTFAGSRNSELNGQIADQISAKQVPNNTKNMSQRDVTSAKYTSNFEIKTSKPPVPTKPPFSDVHKTTYPGSSSIPRSSSYSGVSNGLFLKEITSIESPEDLQCNTSNNGISWGGGTYQPNRSQSPNSNSATLETSYPSSNSYLSFGQKGLDQRDARSSRSPESFKSPVPIRNPEQTKSRSPESANNPEAINSSGPIWNIEPNSRP